MNDLTEKYINETEVNPNLAFLLNEWDKWRILALQGGTRSGKTFSIVDFVIYIIEQYKGLTISITRETLPSLKATVLRDFKEEMTRLNQWSDSNFNKTELEYRHNGNLIEFFSIDDEQKVRGRKRQILICNEVNEIPKDRMLQLMLRTEGIVIMDYNPSMVDSYIYDMLERDDCSMIVTTYKNNPFLSPEIVAEIERLKETDEQLWKIYGCGIKGEDRAGTIYTRWVRTDTIPTDLPTWYGVDFGFVSDPCAIVRISYSAKERTIWLKEVAYEKGLMNSDLARIIKQDIREKETEIYKDENLYIYTKNNLIWVNGNSLTWEEYEKDMTFGLFLNETLLTYIQRELNKIKNYLFEVYCDSAEPKSIQELRMYGISSYPCIKGAGSIGSQIFFLYNFRILYSGENIDNERKKYKWKERPKEQRVESELGNVPIDAWNHSLDAIRYSVFTHLTRIGI